MTSPTADPTREEVLDAFAVEPNVGRETLEYYLRQYPQFAAELVDLSRELSRTVIEHEGSLSKEDEVLIDAAWKRHMEAAPTAIADPFASLSVDELRGVAKRLDLPRQVITAFRERKVEMSSVPRQFLTDFAAAINVKLEQFVLFLSYPAQQRIIRSYKADEKPEVIERVLFEKILIDAGVPEEKRMTLLTDHT